MLTPPWSQRWGRPDVPTSPTRRFAKAYVAECAEALKVCRATGDWKGAVGLLGSMRERSVEPNMAACSIVVNVCRRPEQWQAALEVLRGMHESTARPNAITYNSAISVCEVSGQWQAALHLLRAMPLSKETPNVISYSSAISACGSVGQWRLALGLLHEMPTFRVAPNVITFCAGISACEKGREWELALRMLSMIPESALLPDVIAYSSAISACEKGGQWQPALDLLGDMQRGRVRPNVITYNSAISACSKDGQWLTAMTLMDALVRQMLAPDAITYNSAMSACEKAGQWQAALGLMSRMLEARLAPCVITYGAAISSCLAKCQWQRALGMLTEMRGRGLQPDVISYDAAIAVCAASGRWEAVMDLVREMVESGMDSFTVARYDHVEQAGSSVDCFKHVALLVLLRLLVKDGPPLTYVDTHAGRGVYDLSSEGALQDANHEQGIARLRGADGPGHCQSISDFLGAQERFNEGARAGEGRRLRYYLGSPALAKLWLRPEDRGVVFEISEVMHADLTRSLSLVGSPEKPPIEILRENSYWWLLERGESDLFHGRGLVLMDPPYEPYEAYLAWNLFLLRHLRERWPSSCVAMWYPCAEVLAVRGLYRRLLGLDFGEVLVAEFGFRQPSATSLQHSGLLLLNPPAAAEEALRESLAELGEMLERPPSSLSRTSVFWLSDWDQSHGSILKPNPWETDPHAGRSR